MMEGSCSLDINLTILTADVVKEHCKDIIFPKSSTSLSLSLSRMLCWSLVPGLCQARQETKPRDWVGRWAAVTGPLTAIIIARLQVTTLVRTKPPTSHPRDSLSNHTAPVAGEAAPASRPSHCRIYEPFGLVPPVMTDMLFAGRD